MHKEECAMEAECVVCLQLYDDQSHTPRVLSCGHCVCHTCVADLRSHWGESSAASGLVQCPECKQHTKIPLGGVLHLPKNIELMRFLQGSPRKPRAFHDSSKPWLLSESVFGEPAIWVLPESAIKLHDGGGFRLGELGEESVALEFLARVSAKSYEEGVREGWGALPEAMRRKLVRLMGVRGVAEVVGLWASTREGALFLVSKVWRPGIQQARRLFSGEEEGGVSVRTRTRLGLELCEILMEVHAAGVVVGALGKDFAVLDRYGHLRLLAGSSLFWKRDDSKLKFEEMARYECLSPEVMKIVGACDETEKLGVTEKVDVWLLGYILLRLLSETLEQNERLKGRLLSCMASVPSDRPRVVDVWRELKELLEEDQVLGMSVEEGKLDLEVCEHESASGEPVTARVDDSQASEDTMNATSTTSLALIDVSADVKTKLHGHMDTVSCLSVCGDYLISASFDKTLRVWSLNDCRLVQTFKGHEQRITAVAVHEATELCVSGDYAGHVSAWSLASAENSAPVATWQEHQDWRYSGVASLAISDDELLYSGSGDRTIKAWSTLGFKHVATMEGHKSVVSVLMVEGQMLFSGSWDGTIRLWWRPDHSPLADFGGGSSGPVSGIRALVKCPASGLLFSGHDSGVIQIWKEEECVGTLKAHTGVVSALAFDQDWLYSSSWDGFVKAWPLRDVLSDISNPVERKFNQAAVTALCCSAAQGKLFVGVKQDIQEYSHEVMTLMRNSLRGPSSSELHKRSL